MAPNNCLLLYEQAFQNLEMVCLTVGLGAVFLGILTCQFLNLKLSRN